MRRAAEAGASPAALRAATDDDIRRIWPHLAIRLASYLPALSRIPPRDPDEVIAWSRRVTNVLFLPGPDADWLCGLTVVELRTPSVEVLWLEPEPGRESTDLFVALVDFAFDRLGGHRVEWRPRRDRSNASRARAAGMRREAVFSMALVDETGPQDLVLFGALRGERLAARRAR